MATATTNDKLLAYGLWLLRFGAGTFIIMHGARKLSHFFELSATFPDPLHIGSAASLTLASGAELLGALLVTVGLFTRPAALSVLFTMLVAGFVQHAPDPWAKKELALLYAVVFGGLALTGSGPYSLDHWRARRRPNAGAQRGGASSASSSDGGARSSPMRSA
jgi:putative oxidoreductase